MALALGWRAVCATCGRVKALPARPPNVERQPRCDVQHAPKLMLLVPPGNEFEFTAGTLRVWRPAMGTGR